MTILFARNKGDHDRWLELFYQSGQQEVFTHPGYARLWESQHVQACAATFNEGNTTIFYPFLLRDLRQEPFWKKKYGTGYDIITPYGYGGPVIVSAEGPESSSGLKKYSATALKQFYAAFREWAGSYGVVSEFVRFALFDEAPRHYYGSVKHANDNVVVNLLQSRDGIRKGFRYKVMQRVRAARRNGVSVVEENRGERLEEFIHLYHHTMQRRQASRFYFFDQTFFKPLCKNLPGMYRFFHAIYNEEMIASLLVLYGKKRAYSFLAAGLDNLFHLSANDLLQHEAIMWAKQNDRQAYVLGGGLKKNDGIFLFKEAFSPSGIVPFYIGSSVFNIERYQQLCMASRNQSSEYFPAYRSPHA